MARIDDFIIWADQPQDIRFVSKFGNGSPMVTDGYGGWAVQSRPKDMGLTEWQGRNPMAISIPFTLDYIPTDDDPDSPGEACERMVTRLERLCGVGSGDQPPICIVQGHGVIPHDYTNSPGLRWVVENVEWDEAQELRSSFGNRLRCGGRIIVRQYRKVQTLRRLGSKKPKSTKPGQYIVKKGDTLIIIAKKRYKNASKWHRIGDANNIRDPHKKLKVGRHLRIP